MSFEVVESGIDSFSERFENNFDQIETCSYKTLNDTSATILKLPENTVAVTNTPNVYYENEKCDDDGDNDFKRECEPTKGASKAPPSVLRVNSREMLQGHFDTHNNASNQASSFGLMTAKIQGYFQRKKCETKAYKVEIFVIMSILIIMFLIIFLNIKTEDDSFTKNTAKYTYTIRNDRSISQ